MATRVLQAGGVHVEGNPVRQLQRSVGAFPDGKFGPETWGKAIKHVYEHYEASGCQTDTAALGELIPHAPAAPASH